MRTGHRASLIGALVLTAGQTVVPALFCFLVVPLLAGGLGPGDLEGAGAAAEARTVAFSIACGIAGAAVNARVCHELGRALTGALPLRTALGRTEAAQAVTLVACLAGGVTPLAVSRRPDPRPAPGLSRHRPRAARTEGRRLTRPGTRSDPCPESPARAAAPGAGAESPVRPAAPGTHALGHVVRIIVRTGGRAGAAVPRDGSRT
ncbi:hypothetical protein [Streptomyces sp. NPDC001744]|uniref:hypothetical protein n=1 Tax=Streptomyces sp. NPDC001744 TaxID=3364606 RepID=UPI0036831D4E